MSSQTLTLDEVREEAPPRFQGLRARDSRESRESLREDTSLSRAHPRPGWRLPSASAFVEDPIGKQPSGAVQIVFSERTAGGSRTPLRASLEALSQLRSGGEVADWIEVAAVLKRDVARLRISNYSRHAAVLLAMADALTFTEPDEVRASDEADPLFSHALGLLSEPYISEPDEEEFLGQLLIGGWNLAPSEEQVAAPGH